MKELNKAFKSLKLIEKETDGVKFFKAQGGIYIELSDGHNLRLDEVEIKNHATRYDLLEFERKQKEKKLGTYRITTFFLNSYSTKELSYQEAVEKYGLEEFEQSIDANAFYSNIISQKIKED
jgi:hypothetical protein